MVPAESTREKNMEQANLTEVTSTAELSDEQLETVAGGAFEVVRVIAIRADGTNMQMWTTSVTKK
jgi:hypothetical protein